MGLYEREDGLPMGFKRLTTVENVFVSGDGQIVVTGVPDKDHDCDEMGCGNVDHVLIRGRVRRGVLPAGRVVSLSGKGAFRKVWGRRG